MKIEVEQFDKCVLLQFGSLLFNKPLRQVNTAKGFDFGVINYVEMNVEDGNEVIQLINRLPYEDPARCHNPGFGVELLEGEKQIFVCSICWQCNNIFIKNNGVQSFVHFDAQSTQASKLLDKFRFAFNAIIDLEDA
jgi:hypothetical protein